jgi:hypothetical protein
MKQKKISFNTTQPIQLMKSGCIENMLQKIIIHYFTYAIVYVHY